MDNWIDVYGYPMKVNAMAAEQRQWMETLRPDGPHTYFDCGCCGAYHPEGYTGDCRNDLYRIADPDELHGADGWTEIEIEEPTS